MKSSPTLQSFVQQIAEQYGIDPLQKGAYLRLKMEGFGNMVIKNIDFGRVSIGHYLTISGVRTTDPEIVLYVAPATGPSEKKEEEPAWIPVEITQVIGGRRICAEFALDSSDMRFFDREGQAKLAQFVEEVVAENLIAHGWLDHAVRIVELELPPYCARRAGLRKA